MVEAQPALWDLVESHHLLRVRVRVRVRVKVRARVRARVRVRVRFERDDLGAALASFEAIGHDVIDRQQQLHALGLGARLVRVRVRVGLGTCLEDDQLRASLLTTY